MDYFAICKKDFDCVNYDILLSKMKFYGTSCVASNLMESNLRNTYQRVVINAHSNSNGYFSKWEEVQHGVPEGSVLEPLLFLIYILVTMNVGPCHHGMAHPRVADGGTASNMEGSCE